MFIVCMLFTGCVESVNIEECVVTTPAGFWSGLWDGWIFVFSFIVSLFSDSVAVYDVNNSGGWYDFGFLLGIGVIGASTRYKKN